MNVKVVKVGKLETNCYILEFGNKCLIIDPGDDFKNIYNKISKEVVGVLLTHRHFDHIGALTQVLEFYNTDVYNFNNLKEGVNKIENIEFKVLYNPGHTMDSISFIFNDIMFSGDFIFKGTVGRWDIGGNLDVMKESIIKLLSININYIIYPGHGDKTMLNDEREMLEYYLK